MNKLLVLAISSLLFSCSHARTLDVMVYNVENLFDTKHDEGKNDWAYLPKNTKGKDENCKKISYKRYRNECFEGDWTEKKLNIKLDNISDVVLSKSGRTPDILALVEIENENVVKKLADTLRYKSVVVSNSPDKRGVDLAILYSQDKKLKFVSKNELEIKGDYFKKRPTRNILEVEFLVDGKYPLTVFVNHWPSLGNPTIARIRAAETLRARVEELLKKNKNHGVVALGDFNTIPKNHPHPFNDVLLKDEFLKDAHTLYVKDRNISREKKRAMPPGTYFYSREMAWNLLDRAFISPNLLDKKGLKYLHDTYEIVAPKFATRTYEYRSRKDYLNGSKVQGTPKRYDHGAKSKNEAGYSDHFPVFFKLQYK